MKIENCRPIRHHGGGRFRDVAEFDAVIADGFRANGLKLAIAADGKKFVFAPAKNGRRFATLRGDYARQLAEAAWNSMGGRVADEYDQ